MKIAFCVYSSALTVPSWPAGIDMADANLAGKINGVAQIAVIPCLERESDHEIINRPFGKQSSVNGKFC